VYDVLSVYKFKDTVKHHKDLKNTATIISFFTLTFIYPLQRSYYYDSSKKF